MFMNSLRTAEPSATGLTCVRGKPHGRGPIALGIWHVDEVLQLRRTMRDLYVSDDASDFEPLGILETVSSPNRLVHQNALADRILVGEVAGRQILIYDCNRRGLLVVGFGESTPELQWNTKCTEIVRTDGRISSDRTLTLCARWRTFRIEIHLEIVEQRQNGSRCHVLHTR